MTTNESEEEEEVSTWREGVSSARRGTTTASATNRTRLPKLWRIREDEKESSRRVRGVGGANRGSGQNEDDADEELNSDDEEVFMKESYKKIPLQNEIVSSEKKKKGAQSKRGSSASAKDKKGSHGKKKHNKSEDSRDDTHDVEAEYRDLIDVKRTLSEKLARRPDSKTLISQYKKCCESIKKLVKKSRMKNAKKYYKLIHDQEDTQTSEVDYFKKNLSHKEQLRIMKEMADINEHVTVKKPYRLMLLESDIPAKHKATVMQKLNMLRSMEPGDPEYYKLKTWVDTFMRIPFSVNKNLSVTMADGIEKCSDFMENAKRILDECVYGLDDAKMQIMQMVGQWIANPAALGSAIAIKGPPGTGKTSLVKEGISKILGREFAFIALGGTGDASFLEGHSYTYEGSMHGKIVQILIDSKCMNPVIYFDELDKVSDTARGEEIIGILTHLTDTTQNSQFHDKYFSEVDFDLSKCLFIFSYNDESKINPILRDRMYRIQTKGYDAKEKAIIARNFLLPKIREQVNFAEGDLVIPDETLDSIISDGKVVKGEEGVRNLKRCLEIIHTKANLFRLMKPEHNLFVKDMDVAISFPLVVDKKTVMSFIKNEETQNQSLLAMYV
jgi:ATP-dependent Lon protease